MSIEYAPPPVSLVLTGLLVWNIVTMLAAVAIDRWYEARKRKEPE